MGRGLITPSQAADEPLYPQRGEGFALGQRTGFVLHTQAGMQVRPLDKPAMAKICHLPMRAAVGEAQKQRRASLERRLRHCRPYESLAGRGARPGDGPPSVPAWRDSGLSSYS